MGPRLYRTGLARPRLKDWQTCFGVSDSNASGTLRLSVRNRIYYVGHSSSAMQPRRKNKQEALEIFKVTDGGM